MFQKVLGAGNFPNVLTVLLQNRHKRRNINDLLHLEFPALVNRKPQGGQRFSAAGRHDKPACANRFRCTVSKPETALRNVLPLFRNRIRPIGKLRQLLLQILRHLFPERFCVKMLFGLAIVHEVRRIHSVGIHEHRLQQPLQHPKVKALGFKGVAVRLSALPFGRQDRLDLLHNRRVLRNDTLHQIFQRFCGIAQLRQHVGKIFGNLSISLRFSGAPGEIILALLRQPVVQTVVR